MNVENRTTSIPVRIENKPDSKAGGFPDTTPSSVIPETPTPTPFVDGKVVTPQAEMPPVSTPTTPLPGIKVASVMPHVPVAGYCCACVKDMAIFSKKLDDQKERLVGQISKSDIVV